MGEQATSLLLYNPPISLVPPAQEALLFLFLLFLFELQPRTRRGRSLVHAATESFGSERNSKGQQVLQAVLVAAVYVPPLREFLIFKLPRRHSACERAQTAGLVLRLEKTRGAFPRPWRLRSCGLRTPRSARLGRFFAGGIIHCGACFELVYASPVLCATPRRCQMIQLLRARMRAYLP